VVYAQEALVNRALGSTLFWIGLGLGGLLGYALAVCRRAFRDVRTVKTSMPGLRSKAWGSLGGVLGWGLVAAVLVFASVAWLAGWRPPEGSATPASVPTAPASSSPSPSHRP
jgi:hypothetical protein